MKSKLKGTNCNGTVKIYIKIINLIFGGIVFADAFLMFCVCGTCGERKFITSFFMLAGLAVIGAVAVLCLSIIQDNYYSRFSNMTARECAKIINETNPCKYCVYRTDNGCLVNAKKCEEGITKWLNT